MIRIKPITSPANLQTHLSTRTAVNSPEQRPVGCWWEQTCLAETLRKPTEVQKGLLPSARGLILRSATFLLFFFPDPSLTVRADITGRYSNRLYAYEPSDISLCK